MSSPSKEEDLWANLPPLHTIKPEELIRYQIVDWDANNPHHPRYLAGHILIKSLFRRDHYYWIACSNPLPKDGTKKATPAITVSPPTSALNLPASITQPSTSSSIQDFAVAVSPVRLLTQNSQHTSPATPSSMTANALKSIPASSSVGMKSRPESPAAKSNTHPESFTIRPSIPASSPPQSVLPSLGSRRLHKRNASEHECSSPASSPDVSTSQRKRSMKASEQKGRNVRPAPIEPPLKGDGWPVGVEKPADGWLNLGTFSWHYLGSSDRAGK